MPRGHLAKERGTESFQDPSGITRESRGTEEDTGLPALCQGGACKTSLMAPRVRRRRRGLSRAVGELSDAARGRPTLAPHPLLSAGKAPPVGKATVGRPSE